MKYIVFSDFGCTIVRRDDRYFIRYDSGGIVSWLLENEINAEDVEKARKSEKDAYEVILTAQRNKEPRRVTDPSDTGE
jgi:hypothetical protein